MSHRIEKINDLIRDNLSKILQKETSSKPGVFVSIVKVDTSKDLRYTDVLIRIFPEKDKKEVARNLEKNIFQLQKELNSSLEIKLFPKIRFKLDATQKTIDELEKVFQKIKEERVSSRELLKDEKSE